MSPSEKVLSFCSRFLPENSSILAAVSGGSDSVAMVYLLNELRAELKLSKLAVAHVNHGLRGEESDGDEQFVREIAKELGLSFFVKHLSGCNIKDPGVENWARGERYRFFHSVMESGGYSLVATGHTADDQAETVLLRMLRGSGIKGLRGILPCREDGVIRPLLYIRKEELVSWLTRNGKSFRTDSTNNQTIYRRNSIRHQLLPALSRYVPEVVENISSIASRAFDSWSIVSPEVNKWIDSSVINFPAQSFLLKKSGLIARSIAGEGIKALFERCGISASRVHVENVFINAHANGKEFLLPGGWHYFPKKNGIFFVKERVSDHGFSYEIPVPGSADFPDVNIGFSVSEEDVPFERPGSDNWIVFLDRKCCGNMLFYRMLMPEDTFHPLGSGKEENALKYLGGKGVPRLLGERLGVVTDQSNKILWIPGIQINHESRITDKTQSILRIESRVGTDARCFN